MIGGAVVGFWWVVATGLALIARAERQHQWVMAGDDRGVYGDYVPIPL